MLTILDAEILNDKVLNYKISKAKKDQILLCDTHRRIIDFMNMIKYRNNGNYEDLPHYVISKMGDIYQLFDTNNYSTTFNDEKIDRKIIKISIENLGWLNKNCINGNLNNWIGDPYRNEPHIKNWRGYYFWDVYTESQIENLDILCNEICDRHNIPKEVVTSQGYFENASKFKGVVCKSNYSDIYTDINPSFNLKKIFKNGTKDNE